MAFQYRGDYHIVSNSDLAALVKQAIDITEVIGQVVPLRRSGNRYVGLCPFHQEKTPSFHVDSENQFYHCFGCGTGGDVLTFVMKQQNLSFIEAIKNLADRYHIVLPQTDYASSMPTGTLESANKERQQLYEALQIAGDFFYRQLHHSEAGKIARDYLQKRGLPPPLVETERLGYALNQWDGMAQHLERSGISTEVGLKAGLLAKSTKGRYYDRFRNRLIFPIVDDRGRLVAFGGRSLSEEIGGTGGGSALPALNEPKYLNSPETPVYHKGRMLYQHARAREECRQVRQVIMVEGYMDLLAFHAKGFYRVVATLGTALTLQQVRLLRRMCDEVVLAYDADEAGERAMLRALPLFLQEQLAVSCLRFPEGMDPDDFLKNEELGALEVLLREREDLGVYAIRKKLAVWDGSIGGKTRVLTELKPILDGVNQAVLRAEYLRLISDRLSLPQSAITKQFLSATNRVGKSSSSRIKLPSCLPQTQSLEESILRAMIKYPSLIEEVKGSGALDNFQSPQLRAVTETLLETAQPPYDSFNVSKVYDVLQEDELKELFTHFLMESKDLIEAQVQMKDWLQALCERTARKERTELREALEQAELQGNTVQVRQLLTRMQDLCSTKKTAKDSTDNV